MKAQISLDIIIPIYNSKHLSGLLQSIASSKCIQYLNIILVNDGDNKDYSAVLNQFQNLKITYLHYQNNQGPGIARQYGIDHSTSPFITFIDSDDIFLPNGLEIVIKTIQENPNKYLYLFDFIENNVACSKIYHFGTMGQVYAREFLNLYNLKFPTKQPYYLEDYGFNSACMYILKYYYQDDKIYHITNLVAKNIGPTDSLTRKNYNEFVYKNWPLGSAYNTEYAINTALQHGVSKEFLLFDASKIMSEQCWFYYSTCTKRPEYQKAVLEGCKYYYNNCYKQFYDNFDVNLALELWNNTYKSKISKKIDFLQFLQNLEK